MYMFTRHWLTFGLQLSQLRDESSNGQALQLPTAQVSLENPPYQHQQLVKLPEYISGS